MFHSRFKFIHFLLSLGSSFFFHLGFLFIIIKGGEGVTKREFNYSFSVSF